MPSYGPTVWAGLEGGSTAQDVMDLSDEESYAAVTGAAIGGVAIALIIIGSICACIIVVITVVTGGALIARKTMYTVDQNDISGEIIEMSAIPKAQEFVPDEAWVAKRMSLSDMQGFNPMARHHGPRSSIFDDGSARNASRSRSASGRSASPRTPRSTLALEMRALGEIDMRSHSMGSDEEELSEEHAQHDGSARSPPHAKARTSSQHIALAQQNPMVTRRRTQSQQIPLPPHVASRRAEKRRAQSLIASHADQRLERTSDPWNETNEMGARGNATPRARRARASYRYDAGLAAHNNATRAPQDDTRADQDGTMYSKADFIAYYGGTDEWDAAKRCGAASSGASAADGAVAAIGAAADVEGSFVKTSEEGVVGAAVAAAGSSERGAGGVDEAENARVVAAESSVDDAAVADGVGDGFVARVKPRPPPEEDVAGGEYMGRAEEDGRIAASRSHEPSEESEPALFLLPEEESDNAPPFGDEDDLPPPMDERRKSPVSEEAPGWTSFELQGDDADAGAGGVDGEGFEL